MTNTFTLGTLLNTIRDTNEMFLEVRSSDHTIFWQGMGHRAPEEYKNLKVVNMWIAQFDCGLEIEVTTV